MRSGHFVGHFSRNYDDSTFEKALALAKGHYQEDILKGRESLSGSTLKGKARQYGDRYKQSAQNFLARCQAAGLPVREERGARGVRLIIIGGTQNA